MPLTTVLYTVKSHIAHITLNRPGKGNAINQRLAQELEEICGQINRDCDIYVVILAGAGKKYFCRGREPETGEMR